jgi:hypothetical protein
VLLQRASRRKTSALAHDAEAGSFLPPVKQIAAGNLGRCTDGKTNRMDTFNIAAAAVKRESNISKRFDLRTKTWVDDPLPPATPEEVEAFRKLIADYKPRPDIFKNNWGEWVTPDGFSILFKKHGKEFLIRKTIAREIVRRKDVKTFPVELLRKLVDDCEEAFWRQFGKDL